MTNLKLPEDFETYPEARKNAFLKMKELKESGRDQTATEPLSSDQGKLRCRPR